MSAPSRILKEALNLKPAEKAALIDKLLSSLDKPDPEIEALWAEEAEDRIDAFERGAIKSVAVGSVLKKHKFAPAGR